jgi:soluble lytic murein transglycosylase-like protein
MQINKCNHKEIEQLFGYSDMLNPKQNIVAGIYLLSNAHNIADGDINKTLMTYNMGETKAKSYWKQGIYETDYTRKVCENIATYRRTE